jgi:hypothetical protein
MIFGKTNTEKKDQEQAEIAGMIRGEKNFALFPVKLKSGKWIWFNYYWTYYFGGIRLDGDLFLWYTDADSNNVCHNNYAYEDWRNIQLTEPVPGKDRHNHQGARISEDLMKPGGLLYKDI